MNDTIDKILIFLLILSIGFGAGFTIRTGEEKEFSLEEAEARIDYAQAFYRGERLHLLKEAAIVHPAKGYLPPELMNKNLTVAELLETYEKYPALAKMGLAYIGSGLCR